MSSFRCRRSTIYSAEAGGVSDKGRSLWIKKIHIRSKNIPFGETWDILCKSNET